MHSLIFYLVISFSFLVWWVYSKYNNEILKVKWIVEWSEFLWLRVDGLILTLRSRTAKKKLFLFAFCVFFAVVLILFHEFHKWIPYIFSFTIYSFIFIFNIKPGHTNNILMMLQFIANKFNQMSWVLARIITLFTEIWLQI